MTATDDLRARVREEIIANPLEGAGGDPFPEDGSGFFGPFVRESPQTALAFHRYLKALEDASTLEVRLLHLIWMGVDAVVTHLFDVGAQMHARAALDHGATVEQLFEVLCIASAVSNRSCEQMVPMLAEELARAGHPAGPAPLSDEQQAAKDRFIARNGYWTDAMELSLAVLPDYYPKVLELHSLSSDSALTPIERALVFFALSASPPILDVEGARRHDRRALELGADPDDVRSALQSCASLGVHSFAVGVGIAGAISSS